MEDLKMGSGGGREGERKKFMKGGEREREEDIYM